MTRLARSGLAMAALFLAACGGPRLATGPSPEPSVWVVHGGSLMRARLEGGEEVTGRLLESFRPESPRLLLCVAEACADTAGPGVRAVPAASIKRLHLREKQAALVGRVGLSLGAITGALLEEEDGVLLLAGGVVGAVLGAGVGSRITGWTPLIPCTHICGWSYERPAAPPPSPHAPPAPATTEPARGAPPR
jgi:hypothetical protein